MIKKATVEDLEIIIDFKLKMFEDVQVEHLLCSNSKQVITEKYLKLYKLDKAVHYLKETNNEVVACAGAFIKDDIPYCFFKKPYYGFIGDVYTLKDYRNLGYAKQLTKEVIQWLRIKDIDIVRLLASEAGQHVYKKLGFDFTGEMVLNLYNN